ncbi:MAG: BrnT family toxin [Spirochaetes bacterium]|nr:MAG: BrnT family toxin [Spirochaetota bacterium]
MEFEWEESKNAQNIAKHGVSFYEAQNAFLDAHRVIALDVKQSTQNEKRYFCYGNVLDRILTVRFTVRASAIRIIGAGYWREGKKRYEEEIRLY